jgi:hypothetical protein
MLEGRRSLGEALAEPKTDILRIKDYAKQTAAASPKPQRTVAVTLAITKLA